MTNAAMHVGGVATRCGFQILPEIRRLSCDRVQPRVTRAMARTCYCPPPKLAVPRRGGADCETPQPAVPARIVAALGFPAMTTMWGAPLHRRWRGSMLRDPRQAKFLTLASLKWVLANRAYTPWYLVRYWRLLKFKLANPHIITRGMVFLGKGVEIHCTPELAQLEIGRWVHIGDKNTIRAHEGSLRFGDKVVLGRDNVINCYLDIELGDS